MWENRGIEIGIEKGRLIGRIQLLQELLELPEKPTNQLAYLSREQLAQLQESLYRQLNEKNLANGTPARAMDLG
jgi:hypothetical protein